MIPIAVVGKTLVPIIVGMRLLVSLLIQFNLARRLMESMRFIVALILNLAIIVVA